MKQLFEHEAIVLKIFMIRGHRVILDADLATIYGVTTKRLNQQIRRNQDRFPDDFIFQLIPSEYEILRSQFATLRFGEHGKHRKYLPYVFTEHGALMAANVLNNPIAVKASVQVVRAFVRLRGMLASHKELAQKLDELEMKYDGQFKVVFNTIRRLMAPPKIKRRKIGFHAE